MTDLSHSLLSPDSVTSLIVAQKLVNRGLWSLYEKCCVRGLLVSDKKVATSDLCNLVIVGKCGLSYGGLVSCVSCGHGGGFLVLT
jgi:hypothetical protein